MPLRTAFADSLFQDLRHGTRLLRRNPAFTAVAVLALAVGIGVNTAVFTAYRAMVARPVDAREPGNLVNLALIRRSGASDFAFSYPDYESYRESLHSFSGLMAFRMEHMTLSDAGAIVSQRASTAGSLFGRLGMLKSGASNAEFASVFVVSANYFKVLGVEPLRGRSFEALNASELLAPSVMISENYWQRRFQGDPAVLGKTIRLNGSAFEIIGITPRDFVGTSVGVPDFWLPLTLMPLVHPSGNWLHDRENECCRLFGRLAPGVSLKQAQAEMMLAANRLRALHDAQSEAAKPVTALVWPASPFPLPLRLYRGLELTISLTMLAAAMLLAVACGNVGSLYLARARSRQDELHTRLSLGASRIRVIRQLLTESVLLGLIAGAVALLLAWAFLQVMVVVAAQALPAEEGTLVFHVAPDLRIFAYVLAISLAAGILFGLAPAIESSSSALASGTRTGTSSVRTRRLQDLLVTAQISLSLVLLIAGSMLIHSSIRSLKADPGYDSKHVVDLEIQFPEATKYTAARKLALMHGLRTRLAALPGVVAVSSARPPDDFNFRTAAVPLRTGKAAQSILYYTFVQPNYFETLGIPVFLGRAFESRGQPEYSVVLSESAAKELFPGENPIGRSLRLGLADEQTHTRNELVADGPAFEVVGIARDTRGIEFNGSDSRKVYLPLTEDRLEDRPLLIRARSNPARLIKAMDPLVSSVDPALIATCSTLDDLLRQSPPFLASSFAAMIASSIGALGLLLALMGIYGTVSYIVVLRTREVGIRMAVGAQRRDILGLILRESARPVIAGLIAGMFFAIGASYALHDLLYGLAPVDAISFAGVSLLFLTVAMAAVYPPSRRAMRIDPAVALRWE